MSKEDEVVVVDRGDDFEDEEFETVAEEEEDGLLDEEEVDDDEDEDIDQEDEEDEENDEDLENAEEEEEAAPQGNRIPKSRLDEVIAQREQEREEKLLLQEQMNRMMDLMEKSTPERQKEAKIEKFEYDFDTKEDEYAEAILDNEKDKAKAIRAEIRSAERRMVMEDMESLRGTAVQEAKGEAQRLREESRFEKAILVNEAAHPFLDQQSDDYNQAAVDRVNDLYGKFAKSGMPQAAALQEAVDLIAPGYVKEKVPKKGLGGERRKAALKKNATANNKQPPKLRGKTSRKELDDYDLATMSDNEYAKLPASAKRKLRGD